MSDHTTGDMGGSRRNVSAHPSPQVHLLVDSMEKMGWQKHTVRGFTFDSVVAQLAKIAFTDLPERDKKLILGANAHRIFGRLLPV